MTGGLDRVVAALLAHLTGKVIMTEGLDCVVAALLAMTERVISKKGLSCFVVDAPRNDPGGADYVVAALLVMADELWIASSLTLLATTRIIRKQYKANNPAGT